MGHLFVIPSKTVKAVLLVQCGYGEIWLPFCVHDLRNGRDKVRRICEIAFLNPLLYLFFSRLIALQVMMTTQKSFVSK